MAGFRKVIGVFRHANYARYTVGNSISLVGLWMQRIAIGWLTWELTASPTWLGLIAMAEFFPVIVLGPIGGVLADRFRRTTNILVFQCLALLVGVVLCVVTALGLINIWLLAALTLILGLAAGLNSASRLALAPSLVPSSDLTTAIAVNSMVFNSARFVGPALAGVVIKIWGVEAAFAANAASYLTLIWALILIRRSQLPRPRRPGQRGRFLSEMADGFAFVAANQGTKTVLLLMLATALLVRPVVQLLPGIADRLLASGVDGFASLSAVIGVGAVAGGYWMAQKGGGENFSVGLIGVLVAVFATIALVLTSGLLFALPVAFVLGAGLVVMGVGMQSTLQTRVPEEYRGRVLSLYGICFMGGPAVGSLIMGAIAEHVGLRPPIVAGSAVVALGWYGVWRKRRDLERALDTLKPASE